MNPHKTSTGAAIDWAAIFSAFIILCFSLIISAILIFASQQYQSHISEWTQTQRSHFGAIEKQYTLLQEALDIVDSLYLEKFNQFITEGFFANHYPIEEQRLKMFGEIQTLLSKQPLFTADYALSETKLYPVPDFLSIENQFKTYETQLIFKLGLLHEEDILKIIEAIEVKKFAGLFNWQSCDIKRLGDSIDVKDVGKPYLKVNCVLAWYTSSLPNS